MKKVGKTVLVTGASGFIGSALCQALLRKGYRVVGLSEHPTRLLKQLAIGLKKQFVPEKVDIRNRAKVIATMKHHRPVAVFHTAAIVYAATRVDELFSVNAIGTLHLLEAARQCKVRHFIYSSSMSVYGVSNRRTPRRETDSPTPDSIYGLSKLQGEDWCRFYATIHHLPVTVLRYSGVYGPGRSSGSSGAVENFITQALQGRPLRITKHIRWDIIPVDDAVLANLLALKTSSREPYQIFNIGLGKPVDNIELAKKIIHWAKSVSPISIADKNLSFYFYYDIHKAKQTLRYKPTSLEQGIGNFLAYLKTNKREIEKHQPRKTR